MADHLNGEDLEKEESVHDLTGISYKRSLITVMILAFLNLITFMDRFVAAGVMPELQEAFKMDDSKSGLLHTVFIAGFMLLAPLFGYIGDRWNRKYIICVGTFIWTSLCLASSFIPTQYAVLLTMRGLIGATETGFSTIAPSLIADLFVADQRSRMLAMFYLTIPVGSGLGYIVGSKVTAAAAGNWHWALRVTPCISYLVVLLMIFLVKEPTRGGVDRTVSKTAVTGSHFFADIKALLKNRSFMLSTLGSTAVAFVVGAIGLWAPSLLTRAHILKGQEPCPPEGCKYNDSMIFGLVTIGSGILGVIAGVEISKRCRKFSRRADPIVCACGMLGSAPFLFLALTLVDINIVATYVCIFIAETLICLNWAIVTDILLYVVTPLRRSTANAIQIVVSDLLGDAGSPYIIGVISEAIRRGKPESPLLMLRSLEYALMSCGGVVLIGGIFFLATAIYVVKDREKAETEAIG